MAVTQLITAEHFLMMPEVPGKWLELVAGEPVERPLFGARAAHIAMNLFRALNDHVRPLGLGEVFTSGLGYILHRDPDTVRMAVASFIAEQHIPMTLPEGFWPGTPDIAVEMMLPNQCTDDLHTRVREFIEAGAPVVWVLWPDDRLVRVYTKGMPNRELGADDELDGGAVLPGFTVRVSELFAMPTRPQHST